MKASIVFLSVLVVLVFGVTALGAESVGKDGREIEHDCYLSGNAGCRVGDYEQAIASFRRCVALNPDYYYARLNLGVALARTGRFEEAIEQFTFCIDGRYGCGADRFVFHFNRALAAKEHGLTELAANDRAALEKLDPDRRREFAESQSYLLMDAAYIETRNEAARNCLLAEHRASILRGKVVVRKVPGAGKNTEEYETMGLIDGTLEEVSGVLADFEKYPEFVPNVEEMTIRSVTGDEVVVDWQLQLPMGFVKKYRLKCWTKREPNRIQRFWKKVPWPELKSKETIVDTYGQWILETVPGRDDQVLAYYRVYTDPGPIPWGAGWIVEALTKSSVPDIIKKTRKRVKDLFP